MNDESLSPIQNPNSAESFTDNPTSSAENAPSSPFFHHLDEENQQRNEKSFAERFQSFFEPEEEKGVSDEDSILETFIEETDDSSQEPLSPNDDEYPNNWMAREEEEALKENIDALNQNSDDSELFVLGRKYDPEDEINISDDDTAEKSPTSILEAMLFVGDRENRPLFLDKAIELMRNVTIEEVLNSIDELNHRYELRESPYRIIEDQGGYRMALIPEAAPICEHFGAKVKEIKLSQKAIEVLAIIAYRQPITLSEIQLERPNTGSLVAQLQKRGLVTAEEKIIEKKKLTYYRTSPRFLQLLGIDSLDDLPIVDEIDYR